MRSVLILCLALISGFRLMAQGSMSTEEPSTPNWQVGLVASEIVVPALSLDASVGFMPGQHIGIRLSRPYYQSFDESDLYQRVNWAFKGGVYHKIFVPINKYDMLTIRHGARFGFSDLAFDATVWDPYTNLGNTFYEYRDVTFNDQVITMGYELLGGWQSSYRSFYFEIYGGLSYEFFLNSDELTVFDYKPSDFSLDYFGPGYEYNSGIRPVLGLVIGLTDPY